MTYTIRDADSMTSLSADYPCIHAAEGALERETLAAAVHPSRRPNQPVRLVVTADQAHGQPGPVLIWHTAWT